MTCSTRAAEAGVDGVALLLERSNEGLDLAGSAGPDVLELLVDVDVVASIRSGIGNFGVAAL
jgi:hypothetical protein